LERYEIKREKREKLSTIYAFLLKGRQQKNFRKKASEVRGPKRKAQKNRTMHSNNKATKTPFNANEGEKRNRVTRSSLE